MVGSELYIVIVLGDRLMILSEGTLSETKLISNLSALQKYKIKTDSVLKTNNNTFIEYILASGSMSPRYSRKY